MSLKRQLTESEKMQAMTMLNKKMPISKIAKHFNVNKPAIFKALKIWETEATDTPMGIKVRMHRGRAMITESDNKEILK